MNLPLTRPALDSRAAANRTEEIGIAPTAATPVRPELGPLLAVLLMLIDEHRSAVVHVTAAVRNEGTSTVAREMAAAVAASGWNVAAIDAHRGSEGGGKDGLLDAAERGDVPVLEPGTINGRPVATGSFSSGGVPAVRLDNVRSLYAQMRSQYALTVVDCPPVLSGSGAAVLGSAADGTVLVVEAERTRVEDVHRACERLQQVGAPVLGVVLNKSRSRVPRLIGRFL